ncbi:Beta-fructofuranosidase insoluble isoenzyme 1 [Nymphaea thermarum]|nr:Beta-fructofuranosidase insoluble isoenzyme 1 [Nymphaea thermarum]
MDVYRLLLCFVLVLTVYLVKEVHASHHVYEELKNVAPNSTQVYQYRAGYHFQPPSHWINGPLYYKGVYHLFYQYNPYGAVWGNIVWAHSVSTDLINWLALEPAIYPTGPFDINGCWSGSATILPGGTPAILYTGINTANQQVQNIAVPKNPSDPFLREWVKPSINPLMAPTIYNQINSSSFRDPTTAWQGPDGRWRVLVGSKRGHRGMALLYRSKDFSYWVKAKHPLHSAEGTGMWECPDFYPVSVRDTVGLDTSVNGENVKHVLKASLDDKKYEYYTVGTYLHEQDRYVPDNTSADDATGLRYDYGKFYASKTFFDGAKNRRILLGWMNESDSVSTDVQKGWAGVHSIPRRIWLDPSGRQLVQWPVEEIEALRGNQYDIQNKRIESGSVVEVPEINASQADVEVTFDLYSLEEAEVLDPNLVDPQLICSMKGASIKGGVGPFGVLVLASKDMQEQTAVFFRVFKGQGNKNVVVMCSDQSKSTLAADVDTTTYGGFVDVDLKDGKLSLRSLIDHSIVESFGAGGKTCITARVYPKTAVGDDARLFVFNNGSAAVGITRLSAWTMLQPSVN